MFSLKGMRGQYYTLVKEQTSIGCHVCIGVGDGRHRRCKTCQSLPELDSQGTVFRALLFLAVTRMVIEFDHVVRGGES